MPKRRLQDELIKLGLADNTVVSLIGDHGQHVAEKKPFEKDDQLCESVGGSVGELVGKLRGAATWVARRVRGWQNLCVLEGLGRLVLGLGGLEKGTWGA